jgi:hypothetical protein
VLRTGGYYDEGFWSLLNLNPLLPVATLLRVPLRKTETQRPIIDLHPHLITHNIILLHHPPWRRHQLRNPMEHQSRHSLFRPLTSFRDSDRHYCLPENWTEVELLPGLKVDNHFVCDDKVVGLTPNAFVSSQFLNSGMSPLALNLGVDAATYLDVYVAEGTTAVATATSCNFSSLGHQ